MEIITTFRYSEKQDLVNFLKKEIKPFSIRLMDPKVVVKLIDNKTHAEIIEVLISHYWSSMMVLTGTHNTQIIPVKLEDDIWMMIHLIVNGLKEKLVLITVGKTKDPDYLHLGYIGSPETFESYRGALSLSTVETYGNLSHLIED